MPTRLALLLLALAACLAVPTAGWSKPRDRDHDRLPDRWERRYDISTEKRSARRDPDRDRLKNLREYRVGTNPRRADTDRDGFKDGVEVRAKTDPRSADSRPGRGKGGGKGKGGGSGDGGGTDGGAPPSGGCPSSTPNTPDGPDPFGGCFPGPATTGVPAGTQLTQYSGPCTITAANTVIDAKTVNCSTLNIAAAGVVITRSHINGSVWIDDPRKPYSFTIRDSEVDAGPVDATSNDGKKAIGKSNFVAERVETVRGISGVFCEYNCTLKDSWVHGQDPDESGHAHMSGVRQGSGATWDTGQKFVHNSIRCDAPDIAPDAGCSADITGYGDFAPIQNNYLYRNLVMATTGGTCAYGGSGGGAKPYDFDANNNKWIDNVFQHRNAFQSSGNCGYWFAISGFRRDEPGNEWTNNRWDTGELVPSDG